MEVQAQVASGWRVESHSSDGCQGALIKSCNGDYSFLFFDIDPVVNMDCYCKSSTPYDSTAAILRLARQGVVQ